MMTVTVDDLVRFQNSDWPYRVTVRRDRVVMHETSCRCLVNVAPRAGFLKVPVRDLADARSWARAVNKPLHRCEVCAP